VQIAPDSVAAVPLAQFDYDLPPERIAQEPVAERELARLMVLDRRRGTRGHRVVRDLPALLRDGDVLVLNDTRVRPARLRGRTESGAAVELLFVRALEGQDWHCIGRPAKRLRTGAVIHVASDVSVSIRSRLGAGGYVVTCPAGLDVAQWLRAHGEIPLPPYIARRAGVLPLDRDRYQTVFARVEGAVAAPTAGLHFTPGLLMRVREIGVTLAWLTLHVGPGTFLPVRAADARAHAMDAEWASIPHATADAVNTARREGRRVVAVGTTTVRALESAAATGSGVRSGEMWADAFILPGFTFRVTDALLTNFHLPRSTLLMLVAAFAGREQILTSYAEAVHAGYRFYSYGDAMLID
jgi:S-adenosylmethionine:tRNA ribosyltransferase-isomerase